MRQTVLDKFRLDGSRAVVTGGSRGLGREMALALAEAGADILLIGRSADALAATSEEVLARGRKVHTVIADVTDTDQCTAACREALASGPVDILVNNVGGRNLNVPV